MPPRLSKTLHTSKIATKSGTKPTPRNAVAGTMTIPDVLPRLIAFDLDATLWWPEMYMLTGAPFQVDKREPQYLVDKAGERVELMGASRAILRELATDERWTNTVVAYVSRCDVPRWAASCLNLFEIAPGVNMHRLASEHEIYPGSKCTHFRRIQERTGISFEEMLFFDNERWNISDVAPMGVCSVHCPDGMTEEIWTTGLEAFAAAKEARDNGKKPKLAIKLERSVRW